MATISRIPPVGSSASRSTDKPQSSTQSQPAVPMLSPEDDALSQKYEVVKRLAGETWLLRRRDDPSAEFLGVRDDAGDRNTAAQLKALLDRGARPAVEALLNHSNLICLADMIPWVPLAGRGEGRRDGAEQVRRLVLWDYCDAGSLQRFMDRTAVRVQVDRETSVVNRWLPESLCWHVLTSVLKALAWLHDGYREEDIIVDGANGEAVRDQRADDRQSRDEDWLSVLHRDVTAANIFFQHPKGTETYGTCKLGNYSSVYVSGHVKDLSNGHVVCSGEGGDILPETTKVEDIYSIRKEERPYFSGTELYGFGEVLYRMMTREVIPDREECPSCNRQHWMEDSQGDCLAWPKTKRFDLNTVLEGLRGGYSAALVDVLERLLANHRASVDTTAFFVMVKEQYLQWKGLTAEGQRYRDHWDDMLTRDDNTRRKIAEAAEEAHGQSGPDAVDYVQLAMDWAKENEVDYEEDEEERAQSAAA